jgi:hypothetical protein
MCGEWMHLQERQTVTPVPGTPNVITRSVLEWVCPECDYFEETGEEGL